MPPNRPRQGEQLERASWVAEAVRLAIEGYSLREIGAHLGKHHSTVAEALKREHEDRRPTAEQVDLWRQLQMERLHRHLRAWSPKSLEGDRDAALVMVKLEDAIAKLAGTEAPRRTELTGINGGPIATRDVTLMTDEQLQRIALGLPLGPPSEGGAGDPEAPPTED